MIFFDHIYIYILYVCIILTYIWGIYRLILDRGELMTKEQLDVSNLTTGIKSEDQNLQVSFSPSVKYAASDEFTRKFP